MQYLARASFASQTLTPAGVRPPPRSRARICFIKPARHDPLYAAQHRLNGHVVRALIVCVGDSSSRPRGQHKVQLLSFWLFLGSLTALASFILVSHIWFAFACRRSSQDHVAGPPSSIFLSTHPVLACALSAIPRKSPALRTRCCCATVRCRHLLTRRSRRCRRSRCCAPPLFSFPSPFTAAVVCRCRRTRFCRLASLSHLSLLCRFLCILSPLS